MRNDSRRVFGIALGCGLALSATISRGYAAEEPTIEPVVAPVPSAPRPHVDLGSYWAHSFATASRSRDAMGLTAEYEITRRFRLGLDAALYAPFDEQVRFWSGSAVNETRASGGVDARFVIFRPASSNAALEIYLLGGTGLISTRPVSLADPVNREFSYKPRIDVSSGIGARISLNRWIVAGLEVRDTFYNEQPENAAVAIGPLGRHPDTWYGTPVFTNNVQGRLGLTLVL